MRSSTIWLAGHMADRLVEALLQWVGVPVSPNSRLSEVGVEMFGARKQDQEPGRSTGTNCNLFLYWLTIDALMHSQVLTWVALSWNPALYLILSVRYLGVNRRRDVQCEDPALGVRTSATLCSFCGHQEASRVVTPRRAFASSNHLPGRSHLQYAAWRLCACSYPFYRPGGVAEVVQGSL
ncbi:hypothetical protein FKP32DRAFT_69345 [Trametes sanguinea]|nr:hypothetical protein FKP32DRAFT_69345 [Trametes sanguinea]